MSELQGLGREIKALLLFAPLIGLAMLIAVVLMGNGSARAGDTVLTSPPADPPTATATATSTRTATSTATATNTATATATATATNTATATATETATATATPTATNTATPTATFANKVYAPLMLKTYVGGW